jgi:hypothetical protein
MMAKRLGKVTPQAFINRAVCTSKSFHAYAELKAPFALWDGAVASDGYRCHFAPGAKGEEKPGGSVGGDTYFELLKGLLSRKTDELATVNGLELKNAAQATRVPRSSDNRDAYVRDNRIDIYAKPGFGLLLVGQDDNVGKVKAHVPCEIKFKAHARINARFLAEAIAAETVTLGIAGRDGYWYVYSGTYTAVLVPFREEQDERQAA